MLARCSASELFCKILTEHMMFVVQQANLWSRVARPHPRPPAARPVWWWQLYSSNASHNSHGNSDIFPWSLEAGSSGCKKHYMEQTWLVQSASCFRNYWVMNALQMDSLPVATIIGRPSICKAARLQLCQDVVQVVHTPWIPHGRPLAQLARVLAKMAWVLVQMVWVVTQVALLLAQVSWIRAQTHLGLLCRGTVAVTAGTVVIKARCM